MLVLERTHDAAYVNITTPHVYYAKSDKLPLTALSRLKGNSARQEGAISKAVVARSARTSNDSGGPGEPSADQHHDLVGRAELIEIAAYGGRGSPKALSYTSAVTCSRGGSTLGGGVTMTFAIHNVTWASFGCG